MTTTWAVPPSWLLHSALAGGLLLLVAWAVMKRHGQPARRHRLGALGVTAALLAAALCLGPRWLVLPLDVPALSAPTAVEPVVDPEHDVVCEEFQEEEPAAAPETYTPQEPPAVPWGDVAATLPETMALLWVAGAALFLGRFLLGHAVLARLLRTAHPAPARVARLFAGMAGKARPTPRLLVSSRVRVPLSCGLLRPTVVLPPDLCDADEAVLRWVFAHELTHLERRDAWTAFLFGLGQAVYFYLPWFWWLRRQVRLCQEYLADAAATRQAGSAEDYAQFLLTLTTKPAVPVGATGVTGNTSDLYRRVAMLLHTPGSVEKRCGWLWSLAATAGLLALAVFVSGVGLRAEADDDKEKPAPVVKDLEVEIVAGPNAGADVLVVVGADGKVFKVVTAKPGDGQDEKKDGKKGALPKVAFPDVDDLIKNLPPGLSEEQIKQFRQQMQKAREEMQRAMEQVKKQLPQIAGDLKLERNSLALVVGGQGRLGIRVEQPGDALAEQLDLPKGQGLLIVDVTANSAAAKAGLKSNDILLTLDGKPVTNDSAALVEMVQALKANALVDAVVLRKGKRETVKGIALGAAPQRRTYRLQGAQGLPAKIEVRPRVLVQPVPAVPAVPAVPGARIRSQLAPGGKQVTMTINRTNDNFNALHQEDAVTVSVSGTVTGGKAKAAIVEVKDGDRTTKYEAVDRVPEQHRDKVKKLLESVEKGGVKIDSKTPAAPATPAPKKPAGRDVLYNLGTPALFTLTGLEDTLYYRLAEPREEAAPRK